MMNSLTFLYVIYFISIILLLLAIIVTAGFVIPLQFKQLGIKNGLGLLRKQLLAKGVLSLIVSVISIFTLTARFFIGSSELARYIVVSQILIFSLCILLKAIIDSWIYHQQYSEENKEFHEKVEVLEKKREKRNERREVARVKLNSDRRKVTADKKKKQNNVSIF